MRNIDGVRKRYFENLISKCSKFIDNVRSDAVDGFINFFLNSKTFELEGKGVFASSNVRVIFPLVVNFGKFTRPKFFGVDWNFWLL